MTQQTIWYRTAIIAILMIMPCFSLYAQDATSQAQPPKPQTSRDIGREILHDVMSSMGNPEGEKEPILIALGDCLDEHSDTVGMDGCLVEAYKSYDKILNDVYQLALDANDEDTKQSLRASQRKWLSFREAETSAQKSYGQSENRGTILGIAIGYQRLHAIRERISELMFFLGADQG